LRYEAREEPQGGGRRAVTAGDSLFQRLAIIGLGLIGGSFALAARERGLATEIVACDPRVDSLAEAIVRGIIEQGYSSAATAVKGADGVLLAAPVRTNLRLLREITPALAEGAFVMDLGSTKRDMVAAMAELPPHALAVGGHPMAGKEVSGLSAAEPGLFNGATFALCRTGRTGDRAAALAEALATGVGARPLWLDAATHDDIVARVSHLPYLMAAALAHAAAPEGDARALAASGYRDTSRLAHSDPAMMLDILLTNAPSIRSALADASAALAALDELLEGMDEGGLRAWMEEARRRR
jgi:prephenate dehydrogenase